MITALNKDLRQENHQRVQSASENSVADPSHFHEVAMVMMMHPKPGTITTCDSRGPLWTPHSPVASSSQFQSAASLSHLPGCKFG